MSLILVDVGIYGKAVMPEQHRQRGSVGRSLAG